MLLGTLSLTVAAQTVSRTTENSSEIDGTSGNDLGSISPASVVEKTVTDYTGLKEAIEEGGAIALGGNIEIADDTSIAVSKDVTLDLAGYTITVSAAARSKSLFAVGAANLTLQDSGTDKTGKILVTGNCTAKLIDVNNASAGFTLSGGTIATDGSGTLNSNNASLVYVTNGSFTMTGGSLTASIANASARTVIVNSVNAQFVMSGGLIEATNSGNPSQLTALFLASCQSAELANGTVRTENSGTGAVYNFWPNTNAKNITLENMTIEAKSTGTGAATAMYMSGTVVTVEKIVGNYHRHDRRVPEQVR